MDGSTNKPRVAVHKFSSCDGCQLAFLNLGEALLTLAERVNLVHFADFKNHIGFFPTASGIEAFKDELKGYKCTKGTIQIPYTQLVPTDLIRRIVMFRLEENLMKKVAKKK
mgnify:CR=1 FL=1